MSAYLIDNSTISKLADALRYRKSARETDYFITDYVNTSDLAYNLYNLNVLALKERYGERAKKLIIPFYFTNEIWSFTRDKDLAQFFTSLRSFLYQCAEGKVVKTKMFKELTKFKNSLGSDIAIMWADKQGVIWS